MPHFGHFPRSIAICVQATAQYYNSSRLDYFQNRYGQIPRTTTDTLLYYVQSDELSNF